MVAEIRNFYSLKELSENLEKEIGFSQAVVDEYNQRLGSLLRKMEATNGNEEWMRKFSALGKASKEKKRKSRKGKAGSSGWIEFKGLMLSTEKQGEAQILFEAIEAINSKITRLTRVQDIVESMKTLGLGENILYMTYVDDEIPERIVLLNKKGEEDVGRFEFAATLSLSADS